MRELKLPEAYSKLCQTLCKTFRFAKIDNPLMFDCVLNELLATFNCILGLPLKGSFSK